MDDQTEYTNRCACGWEISGTMDEVVDATIDHGLRIHNMTASRDQVVAVLLGEDPAAQGVDQATA